VAHYWLKLFVGFVVTGIAILAILQAQGPQGRGSSGTSSSTAIVNGPARLGDTEATFTSAYGDPSENGAGWYRTCIIAEEGLPKIAIPSIHVEFDSADHASSVTWQPCVGATTPSWSAALHSFLPPDATLVDDTPGFGNGFVRHYSSALLGQEIGVSTITVSVTRAPMNLIIETGAQ
jgi:hypothetical protein